MQRFSKIYIEITNICNLNCSFCDRTNKNKQEMTLLQFEDILKKIDSYTSFIYLHVQGEPLLYSNLEGLFSLCKKYNKKVNITTNGTLLKENIDLLNNEVVRQINISLHCENNRQDYFNNIFSSIKKLNNKYIVYRIWIDNNDDNILKELEKEYGSCVYNIINNDNIKLDKDIYLDKDQEFIWPNINNSYKNDLGTCLGLKSHIAILVDGTVCVCCLDANGTSNLGNIYNDTLDNILQTSKVINTINCFKHNNCYLDICKHCSFKDRFSK